MEQMKAILNGSLLWRAVEVLCGWFGRQWQHSAVIQWFLNPAGWVPGASEGSIFFKLWSALRNGLCWLYEKLHLDRLFAGSVFLRCFFWCMLPVVLAPLVPTMVVLALAVVGTGSLALNLLRDKSRPLAWSPIHRYILLYAAVYLAGTFFSVNLKTSLLPGMLTVAFVLFALVLSNAVTRREQLDLLVCLMVAAGAAVAGWGICQYLFGWGYQSAAWVDSDMFSSITFRVPSTLDNPNMLGQYLILTIPLGGAKLLSSKDWWSRLFYLGCCGLMVICMVLTFSRGAWLGLLFAGAVFFILWNPRFMLLIPFALVALYFVLPDTVINRFTSIGDLGDNSTSYRVYIWMGTLAMLKDYWLCGVGPGTEAFNAVYHDYALQAAVAQHSHNLFLQLVSDGGILVLILFLLIIAAFGRQVCVAIHKNRNWRTGIFPIAALSGVLGWLAQGMTDHTFYNNRMTLVFWAVLGLGAAWARITEKEAEDK